MHTINANEAMTAGMYASAQTISRRDAEIRFVDARNIGDAT
jgi:hypothetical protein